MPISLKEKKNGVVTYDFNNEETHQRAKLYNLFHTVWNVILLTTFLVPAVSFAAISGRILGAVRQDFETLNKIKNELKKNQKIDFVVEKSQDIITEWKKIDKIYTEKHPEKVQTLDQKDLVEKLYIQYINYYPKDKEINSVHFLGFVLWFFERNELPDPSITLNILFNTHGLRTLEGLGGTAKYSLPNTGYDSYYSDGGNQINHILGALEAEEKQQTAEYRLYEYCREMVDLKSDLKRVIDFVKGCGVLGNSTGESKTDLKLDVAVEASGRSPLLFVDNLKNPPKDILNRIDSL